MTTPTAPAVTWLHSLGIALGIGFILAMAASLPDLMCLPGFDAIAGTGKGTALLRGSLFALSQPALFLPIFAGFAVLSLLAVRFPLFFREGTTGRLVGALLAILLLLLGVLWLVLLAPDVACDVWAGWTGLLQVTSATLVLLAALFILRIGDRQSA